MYRMGLFLRVAKISKIFWGMPDFPDNFLFLFFFCGGGGVEGGRGKQ